MVIGVPKEIKPHEYRVSVTPHGVESLRADGHAVLVETGAGAGSGFGDDAYRNAGAEVASREEVFSRAGLVVKVKEPMPSEYDLLRPGSLLFTYLHLAPNPRLTTLLLEKKITALGYETLERDGTLPLLEPMSEIAGRMAPLVGAWYLQQPHGGTGVLPTGATGAQPAKALILGAGTVGANAASVCIGIGMETVVMNRGKERLDRLNAIFPGAFRPSGLTPELLDTELRDADLVIGALYVKGGRTPILIGRDMLGSMKRGAVIVDVSIDQGGCAETSRPTTHDDPVYTVDGVIHYCVANMPGAYPRTSTMALTEATLPYIELIASKGIDRTLEDPVLRSALNTKDGKILHEGLKRVAER